MKYAGFCTEYDGQHDVVGYLLVEVDDGWACAGNHMSSSPGWAQHDIEAFHYDRRADPSDDDTYEWHGPLSGAQATAKFPPAPAPEIDDLEDDGRVEVAG